MGKKVENFSESICNKIDDKNRHRKTKANAKWVLRNITLKKAEMEEALHVLDGKATLHPR